MGSPHARPFELELELFNEPPTVPESREWIDRCLPVRELDQVRDARNGESCRKVDERLHGGVPDHHEGRWFARVQRHGEATHEAGREGHDQPGRSTQRPSGDHDREDVFSGRQDSGAPDVSLVACRPTPAEGVAEGVGPGEAGIRAS